jgi:transposase
MTTLATRHTQEHPTEGTLFVAFELREKPWQLGFSTGHGPKPRERPVTARQQEGVLEAIAQATRRLGLADTAPVVRGADAGRAGCWLHRLVPAHGVTSHGVDSSAIAVNRRQRRAKSAGGEVRKLLRRLLRSHAGERQGWQGGTVPAVEAAAHRHLHRDWDTLTQERARTTTRLQGVRRSQGLGVTSLRTFPAHRDALRRWDGAPMPPGGGVGAAGWMPGTRGSVRGVRRAQRRGAASARPRPPRGSDQVRQWMPRTGMGSKGAWALVRACLGGRACKKRRDVGGVAGGTPTPSQSGASARDPGSTTAGHRHGRWRTMAWAWSGLRLQPARALRVGCRARVGSGGARWRRLGRVAVART